MKQLLAPHWAILLTAVLAGSATAQCDQSPQQIATLIARLGASDYRQREGAHRELAALGPAAMGPLENATAHDDLEVSLRAKRLLYDLQRDAMWSGSPIHVPHSPGVRELLAAIRGQTGIEVNLDRDVQEQTSSMILPLPREIQFWPAVDAVCAALGSSPRWQFTTCGTSRLACRRVDGPVTAAYNGALRCEISGRSARPEETARTGESDVVELTLRLAWEPKLNVVAVQARPRLVISRAGCRSSSGHVPHCCRGEEWNATPEGLPCYTATRRLSGPLTATPSEHVQSVFWDVIAVAPDGTRDRRTVQFDF